MVTRGRRRQGFTLTEVMLTVAIVGILGAGSAQLLLQANRHFILGRTRVELQQEARAVMYVLNRNLRQAQASTVRIDRLASTQPFYSRIAFTKIQGTTMSFHQSGAKLIHTVGSRSTTLTSNLRYLAFTFPRSDDLSIVSVSMTLEKAIYEGRSKALHMASERVRVMN